MLAQKVCASSVMRSSPHLNAASIRATSGCAYSLRSAGVSAALKGTASRFLAAGDLQVPKHATIEPVLLAELQHPGNAKGIQTC
jgi:hypothetical protein